MKRKLLSLLVLLCLTVSGAWADNLYLKSDDNFATATLMYDGNKGDNPYYQSEKWNGSSAITARNNVTTITVNASCQNFTGTSLKYLFQNFSNLTIIKDLGNLNTSNVTNMQSMFSGCSNLTSIDLSSWNTGKVTSMVSMFANCSKLEIICVGADWSVDKVTNTSSMFSLCTKLPNWDGTAGKTHANWGAGGYLSFKLTANKGNEGEYWTTYYSNVTNYKASAGTQVFKVNLSGDAIRMTEITGSIVKSGQGVVLKSTSGCIIMTPSNSGGSGDYSDNSLEGTMSEITNTGTNNYYVLNKKDGTGVGFYKLSPSGTIGANKAYLTYDGSAGVREFFAFDDATGISLTPNPSPVGEGSVYDLQGRRVSQPAKGLYIVNGKKYLKK